MPILVKKNLTLKNNTQVKKSSSKSRELESAVASLEHRSAALYEAVTDVFKGVVMHRYRDVSADIRQICVQHLGTWISTLPAVFLDDSYLKSVCAAHRRDKARLVVHEFNVGCYTLRTFKPPYPNFDTT